MIPGGQPMPQQPPPPTSNPGLSHVAEPRQAGDQDDGSSPFVADAKKTVQSIFQNLVKGNPALAKDPGQLFRAAQMQVDMMKGVHSETADMIKMQLGTAAIEQKSKDSMAKAANWQEAHQVMREKIASLAEAAGASNETKLAIAKMLDQDRRYAADKRLEGSEYSADKGLEGREYSADKGLEGRGAAADATKAAAETRAGAARDVAKTGASARRDVARANNHQPMVGDGPQHTPPPADKYPPAKFKDKKIRGDQGDVWVSNGAKWSLAAK